MAPKREVGDKSVHIVVKHVPNPAAPERLRQAYSVILRAAARAGGESTPPQGGNMEAGEKHHDVNP